MLLAQQQGFAAVAGLEDVVPAALKDPTHDRSKLVLVFDEQDRLGAKQRSKLDLGSERGLRFVRAWEEDLERGPLSHLAVDPQAAAALLDDAEHCRKAEARAFA